MLPAICMSTRTPSAEEFSRDPSIGLLSVSVSCVFSCIHCFVLPCNKTSFVRSRGIIGVREGTVLIVNDLEVMRAWFCLKFI